MKKTLCKNWGWLLALGILLVLLGTAAIILPFVSTISTMLVLGSVLLAASLVEFMNIFSDYPLKRRILHSILALLTLFAGIVFIFNPLASAITLTLFMAFFFIGSGIAKIIMSLLIASRLWIWVLANGIFSVILGIILWSGWPVSGLWAIGMLVGIDLIFNGWTVIMFAYAVHHECILEQNANK